MFPGHPYIWARYRERIIVHVTLLCRIKTTTFGYHNQYLSIACDGNTSYYCNKSPQKDLKKNKLADVGMTQCMNALADKVHEQQTPCTQ